MRFKDRVVIITGGGGKLARVYAMAFAREGAKLSLPDVDHQGRPWVLINIKVCRIERTVRRVQMESRRSSTKGTEAKGGRGCLSRSFNQRMAGRTDMG